MGWNQHLTKGSSSEVTKQEFNDKLKRAWEHFVHMNLKILTPRLLLRPILEKDISAVFKYGSDPEVSKLTSWESMKNYEEAKTYVLEYCAQAYQRNELHPLGIEEKGNPGEIIGSASCYWDTFEERTMSLGAVLRRDKWGQGIVVEALGAVINYAIQNTPVKRIEGVFKDSHAQSERLCQKLGLYFEKILPAHFENKGRVWDMKVYSLSL